MLNEDQILKLAVEKSKANTKSARWAAVVDFTRSANKHRFFLVDVREPKITYSWFTSHGSGSGPHRGADTLKFSNIPNSRMSSKGLYKTAETYHSRKFGHPALRLDGLEKGINDNVRRRAIVMHKSDYVDDSYMEDNKYPGRSWGCITLSPDDFTDIINKLKGGSIVYVHTGE